MTDWVPESAQPTIHKTPPAQRPLLPTSTTWMPMTMRMTSKHLADAELGEGDEGHGEGGEEHAEDGDEGGDEHDEERKP